MMLKFKIGASDVCTGCVLALPKSVWDSWQRHLGRPELVPGEGGVLRLAAPSEVHTSRSKTWIVIFDIDPTPSEGPSPIIIEKIIATSAEALGYYAFDVAPAAAVSADGPVASIANQIRFRLAQYWPELAMGLAVPRRISRKRRA